MTTARTNHTDPLAIAEIIYSEALQAFLCAWWEKIRTIIYFTQEKVEGMMTVKVCPAGVLCDLRTTGLLAKHRTRAFHGHDPSSIF